MRQRDSERKRERDVGEGIASIDWVQRTGKFTVKHLVRFITFVSI